MKLSQIRSCYLGPDISPEQFVPEHFFLFLIKGRIEGFDGARHYRLAPGQGCLVRRNRLIRYNKAPKDGQFEKIVMVLDSAFLGRFLERHPQVLPAAAPPAGAFVRLQRGPLLENFLSSLSAYYRQGGQLHPGFADLKREELLLVLLEQQPELGAVLFDFSPPGKLDIRTFMQSHYRFNVSLERFALMTGRSLSAFKRDFRKEFGEAPGSWLTKKRLDEAHFLIAREGRRPSDVYLELGFEDLSHFSTAFKRQFGVPPSQLLAKAGLPNSR